MKYHPTISLTVRAVRKSDIAYTSASTAENQGESLHAKVSPVAAETIASAANAYRLLERVRDLLRTRWRRMNVMEERIPAAAAVNIADEALTHMAMWYGLEPPNRENMRAVSVHTGFPGGCPTSRRAAVTRYSGQSQKDASGSSVIRYMMRATEKVTQNAILRHALAENPFMLQN